MKNEVVKKANYTRYKLGHRLRFYHKGKYNGDGDILFAYEYPDLLRFSVHTYDKKFVKGKITKGNIFCTMKPNKKGFSLYIRRNNRCVNISTRPCDFFNGKLLNEATKLRTASLVQKFVKKFGYDLPDIGDLDFELYMQMACYPVLKTMNLNDRLTFNKNCSGLLRRSDDKKDLIKKTFGFYEPKLDNLFNDKWDVHRANLLVGCEGFRPYLNRGTLVNFINNGFSPNACHYFSVVENRKFLNRLDVSQRNSLVFDQRVKEINTQYVICIENSQNIELKQLDGKTLLDDINNITVEMGKELFLDDNLIDMNGEQLIPGYYIHFADTLLQVAKWNEVSGLPPLTMSTILNYGCIINNQEITDIIAIRDDTIVGCESHPKNGNEQQQIRDMLEQVFILN